MINVRIQIGAVLLISKNYLKDEVVETQFWKDNQQNLRSK